MPTTRLSRRTSESIGSPATPWSSWGGSSQNWRDQHNAHHGHPNVVGEDPDIDLMPWGRMAAEQPYRPWHRWQYIYLFGLYGIVAIRWQVWGDFASYWRDLHDGTIKGRTAAVRRLGAILLGKLVFWGWAIMLPLALNWSWHGAAMIGLTYLGLALAFGRIMTWIFQLAHCGEGPIFLSRKDLDGRGRLSYSRLVLQVLATSDFCRNSRVLNWYLGGLNRQRTHHVRFNIPHVHYQQMDQLMAGACQEFGLPDLHYPTLWGAIKSHVRHVKAMSRPPEPAA